MDLITSRMIKKAVEHNPDGLRRLAMFLDLQIDGMSDAQVGRLVRGRLTRGNIRGMYERLWEAS